MKLAKALFPRMMALAEVAWAGAAGRDYQASGRDYPGFVRRLQAHLSLCGQEGIYYYDPSEPGRTPEPRQ